MIVTRSIYWPPFDCDGIFMDRHCEIVAGSDYDYDQNGCEIALAPEYEIYYTLADGSFKGSLEEIQASINETLQSAADRDILTEMVEELNRE